MLLSKSTKIAHRQEALYSIIGEVLRTEKNSLCYQPDNAPLFPPRSRLPPRAPIPYPVREPARSRDHSSHSTGTIKIKAEDVQHEHATVGEVQQRLSERQVGQCHVVTWTSRLCINNGIRVSHSTVEIRQSVSEAWESPQS